MCDPVTAAGLALSAGGTFMQQREQNKNISRANKAKEGAFAEHQQRQGVFQDESAAAFNTNLDNQGKDSFEDQRGEEANRIEQAFGDVRTQPVYNVGLSSNAPKNVVVARQRASDEAGAETDRDVGNFANLNAYKGTQFNQGLSSNAFARAFGGIQDKASRDARLLPGEISAAATNSQKAPSLFPTLLKAAGQGMSAFGSAGGSFTNTVEGGLPTSGIGPGAPVTQYGLFSNGQPINLFGGKAVY